VSDTQNTTAPSSSAGESPAINMVLTTTLFALGAAALCAGILVLVKKFRKE
jgi:hypothetical protein